MAEDKVVHLRLGDANPTVKEILTLVETLGREQPDREVFFDGDERAICSRPRNGARQG